MQNFNAIGPLVFEILIFKINFHMESTAVEQAVAFAPVTQWARVQYPAGTSFLGEVFFGVFPHL